MDAETLELLENGDLFEVLEHDHPEFNLYVVFDDEVAHEYDEALDRIAEEVAELPDVVRAVREDREVILVGGPLSAPALEAWLAGWWRSQLGEARSSTPEPATPASPTRSRRFWPRRRREP